MLTRFFQQTSSTVISWIEATIYTVINYKPSRPVLIPIKIQQNNHQRQRQVKFRNRPY